MDGIEVICHWGKGGQSHGGAYDHLGRKKWKKKMTMSLKKNRIFDERKKKMKLTKILKEVIIR